MSGRGKGKEKGGKEGTRKITAKTKTPLKGHFAFEGDKLNPDEMSTPITMITKSRQTRSNSSKSATIESTSEEGEIESDSDDMSNCTYSSPENPTKADQMEHK